MATQNSTNLKVTNNEDGFDISGGSTSTRKVTITGGDVVLTGGGSAVISFPTTSATLATLALTETLTNKTISGASNTLTVLAGSQLSGQVPLANGGTGANLTDPNADRVLFWDDSAGAVTWLTVGSGLSISGTTLTATASGIGGATGSTDNAIIRADGTGGSTVQSSTAVINDAGGISTTIANSGNSVGLSITQNDTTNNPNALTITNAGTGFGASIVQNGAADALLLGGTARIRLQETTAPTGTAGYGKLWVSSSDSKLHFMDDGGVDKVVSAGNLNKYNVDVKGGVYSAYNDATGFSSSNADFDTVWAAIIADIANPAVIEFGSGTFETSDGLTLDKDNVALVGQGPGITKIQGASGSVALDSTAIFKIEPTQSASLRTLTANATVGDLTFTVSAADSNDFATDDYVILFSTDVADTENTGRLYGEIHRVVSVNTGTGVVTIGTTNNGTHIYETMTTASTARCSKITMRKNITIKGITFTDADTERPDSLGTGQTFFKYVDGLTIENCEFLDMFHDGIALWQVLNARIANNVFRDIKDVTPSANTFYGVSVKGACMNVNIANNVFENMRHATTTAAGSSNASAGVVRNLTVVANTSIASYSAHFDCHQGAKGVTIVGNTCVGDDGAANGIGTRSRATITGNSILGVLGKGISLSADAHGSVVSGNEIRGCTTGITVERMVNDVVIANNNIYGGAVGVELARSSATVTMTIASPAVVSYTNHNFTPGTQISFSTTGALPTGVSTTTVYYVIAAGITKDTFRFSATKNGSAVNTSGSQSGTHTVRMRGGNDSLIVGNNIHDNSGNGITANSQQRVQVVGNMFRANSAPIVISNTDSVANSWYIADNYSSGHTSSDLPTVAGTSNVYRNNIGFDSYQAGYRAITGARTLDISDHIVNCTSGTFTVTLPAAANITGREYVIKNSGTGVITVDGNGSETIDGQTTFILATQYDAITIVSDGTNWIIT